MGDDIGFSDQAPALPSGGGAVAGLGATFTPDLSSGTGTFSIPLDAPNGPNDIGPQLGLRYDTASGNGPFGMGFSLPLPRIVRDTSHGYPAYDASDTLLLEGAGSLVDTGGGSYRPQVDGGAWRVQANGKGFRLIDREGWYYDCGTQPAAQLSDPANPSSVFAWHLEQISDPLGNAATFTWQRDGGQLYLAGVAYGAYQIAFSYEQRPDPIRFARCGFAIVTALRCSAIDLRLVADAQPVLRRWLLAYTQDPLNASSLLRTIVLRGFDAVNASLDTPPLTLGYSSFAAPQFGQLTSADGLQLPALGPATTARAACLRVGWDPGRLERRRPARPYRGRRRRQRARPRQPRRRDLRAALGCWNAPAIRAAECSARIHRHGRRRDRRSRARRSAAGRLRAAHRRRRLWAPRALDPGSVGHSGGRSCAADRPRRRRHRGPLDLNAGWEFRAVFPQWR